MSDPQSSGNDDEKKKDEGTPPEKVGAPVAEEAKKQDTKEVEKSDEKKAEDKVGEAKDEKEEKKEGEKPELDKKEGETEEKKESMKKGESKKEEKKDGEKKEEAKVTEKEVKAEDKKGVKPSAEQKEGEKKEEKEGEKKEEKKDETKPPEKKEEVKESPIPVTAPVTSPPATTAPATIPLTTTPPATTAPAATAPVTTAPDATAPVTTAPATKAPAATAPVTTAPTTTAPSTTTTLPAVVAKAPAAKAVVSPVVYGPKATPQVAARIGKKVDPKDLRPAEAIIKTRERSGKPSPKQRSSSGSATISSVSTSAVSTTTMKGSVISVPGKVLDNPGATFITDEEYFKKNKGVLVLRDREIATGTFSSYYRVKLHSAEDQAVKIVTLINATQAYKENLTTHSSKIMRWLTGNPHQSIIKPLDLFITSEKFYMFVPTYNFGNLESLVTPKSAPTEATIKKLMKQIVEGMQFLVSNTIAHKAIKTTHGVFSSADKKQVKLCGFGNAVVAKVNGTVQLQKKILKENFIPYMAPEVLKGDYDPFIADVFSFGLMIIALLTKRYPFGTYKQSRKRTDIWRQHCERFGFKPSKDLEDLIDKIFAEPQSRISLDDLLKHNWFKT